MQSGVVEHIIDNRNKVDEIVPFCIIGETDWQFVQSRELCHIEQQLGHARALRIASFEEMLALVVRHVGIGEYAFEIAMYAGSRSLELVSRILSELSLYSLLVFLAVTQFPEQRDDGVRDVAQFIVRQTAFEFVVELLPSFSFHCKLTQIPDGATDASGAEIEHKAKQKGEDNGEIEIGVIDLERCSQLRRIWHSRTHNEIAETCG